MTPAATEETADVEPLAPTRGTRASWWSWLVPAGLTLGLELSWLTSRSLWQDELATLSATDRSVPDLIRMLAHVDAVLGPYYLLLHVWTAIAGHGPAALRLPSAIAMAAAVGITSATAARLTGPWGGLAAGLLLALTPSVLLYGTEARAYAITMCLAVCATAFLVRALARPARRAWILYAGSLVLLGWTQVTALGLAAAHLVALAVAAVWWRGGFRAAVRPALGCVTVAGVAALPFLGMGHRQAHQVAWIPAPTPSRILQLPVDAFGSSSLGWSVLGAAVLVGGLVAVRARTRPARPLPASTTAPTSPGFVAVLGLCVGVVPVLTLSLASLVTPLTLPRYVLFTLPGWALVAAALPAGFVATVPRERVSGVLRSTVPLAVPVAVLALAMTLGWSGRTAVGAPTRTLQPDFRPLAAALADHEQPGDAIVVPSDAGRRFRVGLKAYLGRAPWPNDVLVTQDAARSHRLDATECTPATCLGRPARLWVGCVGTCGDPTQALSKQTRAAIREAGYRVGQTWRAGNGSLTLMTLPGQG